jgi:hypothetical protein
MPSGWVVMARWYTLYGKNVWYTLLVKNDTFCPESDKTYIYQNLEKNEENSAKKRKY